MFANLSERLGGVIKQLRGQGRLTEKNIQDALRDVRISLLEADVALPVVKAFIEQVREQTIGEKVLAHVNPGQMLVKLVQDQMVDLMGKECEPLNLKQQPPVVILLAGLQGSGKTTSAAKLAYMLKKDNKKVMMVSTDIHRPAAMEQLQKLASDIEVNHHPSDPSQAVKTIVKSALKHAKQQFIDVLIIDSAGRLHVDEDMMQEIKTVHKTCEPIETLFVVDSMTGQDAANSTQRFAEALPLTGVILTKTDGDARGGAALSVRYLSNKPIKFIGIGEKIEDLEVFHPERIVSRILGMGDIATLVEQAERKIDKKKTEKLVKKLRKGKNFNLEDFREQLQQMNKMGDMMGVLNKMPGMDNMANAASDQLSDKKTQETIAIINSMTLQERRFPELIKTSGSRKRRIAKGSGKQVQDVNRLLKQFLQMQKMMKKMGTPGAMKKMMRGMPGLPGGLPKDLF